MIQRLDSPAHAIHALLEASNRIYDAVVRLRRLDKQKVSQELLVKQLRVETRYISNMLVGPLQGAVRKHASDRVVMSLWLDLEKDLIDFKEVYNKIVARV